MKTPPKALGVKTRTEPSHSWLSGLLLPGQTADPAGRTTSRSATTRSRASAKKCTSCARASNGKIARSPAARRSFQASHPCPATGKTYGACKGYVIDHCSAEAWWRRFAGKYAVAVAFGGARKGPDRIAPPFPLQLFCMPDWKNKLFFGDNLGLLNSRGALGHAPIPSKRATHWHHPAFPCSILRTCIESDPAPIIQIRRGRRSRRIADPQHGRSQF